MLEFNLNLANENMKEQSVDGEHILRCWTNLLLV